MRLVLQRVQHAAVSINNIEKSAIQKGYLLLLGIEDRDQQVDIDWLCKKVSHLRIFNDDQGKMNQSILDINGEVLVISQFTLHASTKKGNRPSFIRAARPEQAIPLYQSFIDTLSQYLEKEIKTGEFGANMQVTLLNDGPVTILFDSKERDLF